MTTTSGKFVLLTLALSLVLFLAPGYAPRAAGNVLEPFPLPEFTGKNQSSWFNSAPLSNKQLRGKVVLIDFWTFECWNCYRSFPWLNELEERFAGHDFQVIGIHTPEFEHEKDPQRVKRKIDEFKLRHPVMMDNDFSYWNSMNNRYWPAFYLVDTEGRVRYRFVGETHSGTSRAKAIETAVEALLEEQPGR